MIKFQSLKIVERKILDRDFENYNIAAYTVTRTGVPKENDKIHQNILLN